MRCLKNRTVLTLSFSLGLTAAHFGMAQETSPKNELASLNAEPCALGEEIIKEEVPLNLDERLYQAVGGNDLEEVRQLIESGADVNARNHRYETPLHILIAYARGVGVQDILDMASLLIEYGADVNATDFDGMAALHNTYVHNVRITEFLINQGADVNISSYDGVTPLHMSVLSIQSADNVKLLLDNGANVNAILISGDTPLHMAMSLGGINLPAENLLINAGADMHAVNNKKQTPLSMLEARDPSKGAERKKESVEILDEPICELGLESRKYLDWDKLTYFNDKPTGISSGAVMLDENGGIWYMKNARDEIHYAKEYLCGKLLHLIPTTNIPGNNFADVKLVANYRSETIASKMLPGFRGLGSYEGPEDPIGAELVALAMFLVYYIDGHGDNVGFIPTKEGQAEMALIDYDSTLYSGTEPIDPAIFDDAEDNISEHILSSFYSRFMSIFEIELNGEALQDAAAVIAGIAREDIIQVFEDGHKDILEMGVSISESKINEWRDALLDRYDIICAMAEKMDYFTLVK